MKKSQNKIHNHTKLKKKIQITIKIIMTKFGIKTKIKNNNEELNKKIKKINKKSEIKKIKNKK
jgi:hypothetical protein